MTAKTATTSAAKAATMIPAIRRDDAVEIAQKVNATLLAADQFKNQEEAIAVLAIALAPIIERDGRIEAKQFLEMCGISKRRKNGKPKIDPLAGLEMLLREAQPKS